MYVIFMLNTYFTDEPIFPNFDQATGLPAQVDVFIFFASLTEIFNVQSLTLFKMQSSSSKNVSLFYHRLST